MTTLLIAFWDGWCFGAGVGGVVILVFKLVSKLQA